jgi:predicted DNA-binding ribbon-helix-helix protein
MAEPFGRPVKRSVTIAGHETSISLEPMFWRALEREATDSGKTLSGLIAEIDVARIEMRPMPNLTSAIRQWLFNQALGGSTD